MYRHGDVFIQAVEEIPGEAKKLPHVRLAEGEVTGHCHRIEPSSDATLFQFGDASYLEVDSKSANLVHEEHATIELPRGKYRVWIQREYTPQEIRRVID